MPEPRILVVQHDADKALGRLGAPLEALGAKIDVWFATEQLPELDSYDGLIALPGLADPVDDDPPIHRTRATIAVGLERGLPVLGICLGGQILAAAAGGSVYACTPELGFHMVRATPEAASDALFAAAPPSFSTFHAHAFAFTPPPGSVVLVETDVCPQAFRLGDRVWGIQFHPETDVDWVDGLAGAIRDGAEGTPARTASFFRQNGLAPETLRSEARAAAGAGQAVARGIAEGFVHACRTASLL